MTVSLEATRKMVPAMEGQKVHTSLYIRKVVLVLAMKTTKLSKKFFMLKNQLDSKNYAANCILEKKIVRC